MSRRPLCITKDQIAEAYKFAGNAASAARALNVSSASFKRYAQAFDLYITNQGGKGVKRPAVSSLKIPTESLLKKNTHVKSARLKERLLAEGLIENRCAECRIFPMWNDKPLTLQLDHIDGDSTNNQIKNLRLLCANCHSQTPTYCRGQGKNKAGLAK